jgi:hypothetical protein
VLAKESNTKKRKIHEAAAIFIEEKKISQPSHEIPLLWRSVLKEERNYKRQKAKKRMKELTFKRGEGERENSKKTRRRQKELHFTVETEKLV